MHYHTTPHFDAIKIYSCGKTLWKKKKLLVTSNFSFSHNVFYSYFPFEMHFKTSSAICFNLDQSKILSSGNGLIIHASWVTIGVDTSKNKFDLFPFQCSQFDSIPHSHNDIGKNKFWKMICGKRRCWKSFQQFFFCSIEGKIIHLSHTDDLNFENSEIWICVNHFPNKPWFLCVCSTSLEKTVEKGEIARNKQFLLFLQCLLLVWRPFLHFDQNWNCPMQTPLVLKSLKFGKGLNS